MKIVIAQMESLKGNIEKNIKKHLLFIDVAIQNNSQLIVFPELSLTGYEIELSKKLAISPKDSQLKIFNKISQEKNIFIVVGAPIIIKKKIYIASLIFTPYGELLVYIKQNLYGDEKKIFNTKNLYTSILIENKKIEFAICADTNNIEHIKSAYKNKCNLYIASVLFSEKGFDNDTINLKKYSKKFNMNIGFSNYIGNSGGYNCIGKSSFWDKKGNLIGRLEKKEEGILLVNNYSEKWIAEEIYLSKT